MHLLIQRDYVIGYSDTLLVPLPSHFYKILVRRIDERHAGSLAVMIRNDQIALDDEEAIGHIGEIVVPLARVEQLTGQSFFAQRGGRYRGGDCSLADG